MHHQSDLIALIAVSFVLAMGFGFLAAKLAEQSKTPRRTPTSPGAEKYRAWSAFNLITGVSAPVALIAAVIAWAYLAGQSGSPQPDDWPRLSRILDFVERSLLPLLILCIVAPVAWRASMRGKAWGIYPVPILLALSLAVVVFR